MRRLVLGLMLALSAPLPVQARVSGFLSITSLNGDIAEGDHAALVKRLDARPDSVVILRKLAGGSAAEAELIGQELLRRGVTVEVDGYCATPCAELIALPLERGLKLKKDARLVFLPIEAGLSAYRRHQLLRAELAPEAQRPSLLANAERVNQNLLRYQSARERLQARGASPEFWAFLARFISEVDPGTVLHRDNGDPLSFHISLHGKCSAWAPTPALLRQLGLNLQAGADAGELRPHLSDDYPADRVYAGAPLSQAELALACSDAKPIRD